MNGADNREVSRGTAQPDCLKEKLKEYEQDDEETIPF